MPNRRSCKRTRRIFFWLLVFGFVARVQAHQERPLPFEHPIPQSPEYIEKTPDGWPIWHARSLKESSPGPNVSGPIAPAGTQPVGALSGRIVFTSAGHGWTYSSSLGWFLQRPLLHRMIEDYGNLEQMTMFATYCFNAGATVVPMRPIGYQTNEVVLDNTSSAVTFSGSWTDSGSSLYFGNAGALPYRFASLANSETATATYAPTIPVAGFYPIYTWAAHGANRGDQLYRILHTGGESQVRVPHYMVGNGYVYLGTYHLNAGSNAAVGSVVISNLRGTTNGSVVIADAIRFGNGMGDINQGGGTSDYPREEECARYWVQKSVGQGQSSALYDTAGLDDQDDNVGAPPRMTAEMNREASGSIYKRIYIGYHSNAGSDTARGAVGLYRNDGNNTPNQQRLAFLTGHEVNTDMEGISSPPLEIPFDSNRASESIAGVYGEINGSVLNQEMDATIIEVAFHQNSEDAKIMRDPKGRNWIARASYHAVIKYMNEFDALPLNFLPEPPSNARAIATNNGIVISWAAPVAMSGSGAATGYVVYSSTNGYGFANLVGVSGVGTLSLTLTNLAADTDYYFRVAATNAGGQSLPTETVGCRRASNSAAPKVLIVNSFDRFERTLDLQQTASKQNYGPPDNSGTMDRVMPRAVNSFDYVVQHGTSIGTYGMAFDSCQNEAVSAGTVNLMNYAIVMWACGNESTADETFSSAEQTKVSGFLANGGSLFVSGAEIANDLDGASGPTAADRNFLHNQLHVSFTNDSSSNWTATAVAGAIFDGRNSVTIDDGTKGIYWVQTPDVLVPFGAGATAAMNYSGVTNGAAAVQYDGSAGGGKVVCFGFPFETITSATRRNNYMADILDFFTANTPPGITSQPQNQTVVQNANASFNVAASGTAPLSYQWRFNGANISNATTNSYTRTNAQPPDAGSYTVVVTNDYGAVTSAVAILTVNIPPVISGQPQSQTVTQGVDATFNVVATGTSPLSHQWRFNSVNISGATASSYTRTNTQSPHSGSYVVVVTNVAGSVTSSVVTLAVLVPPGITAHPQNQIVGESSNGTFSVTANGTAPLNYQWIFNGLEIGGATTNSFTRFSATTNDAGNYAVVITNVAGGITSSVVTLTVIVPPVITGQPEDQTVVRSSNALFNVIAMSGAPLNYQWRFNGTNISGATTNSYVRIGAQAGDAGSYSVFVSNVGGNATSSNAVLTVLPLQPPSFDLIMILPDNRVKLFLSGEAGFYYTLHGSSNFLNWTALGSLFSASNAFEFLDDEATNRNGRFYRASSP